MKKMWIYLRPALLCLAIFTVLCGILYTGVITGIAQIAFPAKANGSLIGNHGSELIAQNFSKPEYLIGRPAGGPTNLSPSSVEFAKLLQERIDWWHAFDPTIASPIPADLITASGSGADPHISPAAAEFQVTRIAKSRNMSESSVRAVISKYTSRRFLGVFGEPAVNVLGVNLALDGLI